VSDRARGRPTGGVGCDRCQPPGGRDSWSSGSRHGWASYARTSTGNEPFYRDVLGLREIDEGDDWIQYDVGANGTFELLRRSREPEYDRPRYQVGFAVDNIQAARDELLGKGVDPVTDIKTASDGGSCWAYFRDPEGNVFEITQRP
jgi:predicted enzyme related to lactoylglutathione lyase